MSKREFTTIAEPFSNVESYQTPGGNTVSVGDTLDGVQPKYVRERLTAEVVRIYHNPRGFPGGRFDRANGHVCEPTAVVEFRVPDGHEYDHLDGDTRRVKAMNMDYSLGLRDDV